METKGDLPIIPFALAGRVRRVARRRTRELEWVLAQARQGRRRHRLGLVRGRRGGRPVYGWIDGQAARYDEAYWLQRFTQRRRRSNWSKINRARAIELIERGEMKPAGLAEVERAKADGRWDAASESQ